MGDDNKRIWLQFLRSRVRSAMADKEGIREETEKMLKFPTSEITRVAHQVA